MMKGSNSIFFYNKKGEEDTSFGLSQLMYLIIVITLLILLLAIIPSIKKILT